jgi:hypothetical protein
VDETRQERELLFGRIALDLKLITPEQLTEAVQVQESSDSGKRLGEILRESGTLTIEQIAWVVSVQEERLQEQITFPAEKTFDMLFGQLAIRYGFIVPESLNEALRIQAQCEEKGSVFNRLGEIMVDRNLMKSEDMITTLAIQNGTLVVCRKCLNKHQIVGDVSVPQKCSACGGPLDPPATRTHSSVDYGSIDGFALDE